MAERDELLPEGQMQGSALQMVLGRLGVLPSIEKAASAVAKADEGFKEATGLSKFNNLLDKKQEETYEGFKQDAIKRGATPDQAQNALARFKEMNSMALDAAGMMGSVSGKLGKAGIEAAIGKAPAIIGKSSRANLDKLNKGLENQALARADLLKAMAETGERGAQEPISSLLGARVLEKAGLPENKLVEAARAAFAQQRAQEVPIKLDTVRKLNEHLRLSGRRPMSSRTLGSYYPALDEIIVRGDKDITPVSQTSTLAHELQHAVERTETLKGQSKPKRGNPVGKDILDSFQLWSKDHHATDPYRKQSFEVGKLMEMLKSELRDDLQTSRALGSEPPAILMPPEAPIIAPEPTILKFPTAAPPEAASQLSQLYKQMAETTNILDRLRIANQIEELEAMLGRSAASVKSPDRFKKLFGRE